MNKPSRMSPFILGLILGIVGTIFLPGYVRPYIPQWAMGKATVVKGTIVAKQKKEHALLLTVNTADGALLATFTKKVDEISLLVSEKDVIEFTLPKYAPLIDDPKIMRIVKEQPAAPEPAPVARPAEKSTKEGKLQQAAKPQAVVPAHGSTSEKSPPDRK
ncbi:MAG: hypothetical protein HGB21_03815 [Nitrospirae bacterium]|nr:hypothetical protein [Nitrospirota bacterium]NTW65430.1 hypothetical protein [Nitrospirota bacterium]